MVLAGTNAERSKVTTKARAYWRGCPKSIKKALATREEQQTTDNSAVCVWAAAVSVLYGACCCLEAAALLLLLLPALLVATADNGNNTRTTMAETQRRPNQPNQRIATRHGTRNNNKIIQSTHSQRTASMQRILRHALVSTPAPPVGGGWLSITGACNL